MSAVSEWNDFLSPPTIGSTIDSGTVTVPSSGYVIAVLSAADLQGAILKLKYTDSASGIAHIQLIYGTPLGEGVSELFRVEFDILDGVDHSIPLSGLAPSLLVYAEFVTTDFSTIDYAYVTRSGVTERTTLEGWSPGIMDSGTFTASSAGYYIPTVCIPGRLALYFATTSTDYEVSLRVWANGTTFDCLIGNAATPVPPGLEITTPACTFAINLNNLEAVDSTFQIIGIYAP